MPKLLIYSHDTYGLGNIRRMLAIAAHLSKRNPDLSILLVSGSPMLHAFRVEPQIDFIKLPCLSRLETGKYVSVHRGVDIEQVLRIRANILECTIRDFQPDVLLVDKKPIGLEGELGPAFDTMENAASRPHLVLLLRDILDCPERTRAVWAKNRYCDAIETYYDRVLVVGNRSVFDVAENYSFPHAVAKKMRYCGYLERERSPHSIQATRQELGLSARGKMVLVTVGGGADGQKILNCYIQGLKNSPQGAGHKSLLLCGPEMPLEQRSRFETLASRLPGVQVREFTDDIMRYMAAADVVISMAGYNTICELLTLKKNAIVVPRTKPVLEQFIRAKRLAELGLVKTIFPDELQPELLASSVRAALEEGAIRRANNCHMDMGGLDRVEEEILSLMGAPSKVYLPNFMPGSHRRTVFKTDFKTNVRPISLEQE